MNSSFRFVKLIVISAFLALPLIAGEGKPAKQISVRQAQPQVADLVEALSPAVVYVESVDKKPEGRSELPDNHPFIPFFDGEPGPAVGSGSGAVIHKDGYIVTNNHVIEGGDEIRVTFKDGRNFAAKVVGQDKELDLAVLKVDMDDFVYASFGKSADLRVGEWVVAIGNPLGYRYSVTIGIVSALGRGSLRMNSIESYIQTDAAINRGNSGGPLINMNGEIIGINSVISARGQNLGFAIPSDLVKYAVDQIIAKGKVSRGALGVGLGELTSELKEYFGVNQGTMVQSVNENSPAAKAGVMEKDIILRFNGETVRDTTHLIAMVALRQPGEKISLEILRNGKHKKIAVTLGDRDAIFAVDNRTTRSPEGRHEQGPDSFSLPGLGIELKRLDLAVRRQLELDDKVDGYVVTHVDRSSSAYLNGIREQQIITRINDKPLDPEHVNEIINQLKTSDRVVLMEVVVNNNSRLVGVRPEH